MVNDDWLSLLAVCVFVPVWAYFAAQTSYFGDFFNSYDDEKTRQWLVSEIAQRGGTVRAIHRLNSFSKKLFVVEFTNGKGEEFHIKCKADLHKQRIVWSTDPSDVMPNDDTLLNPPRPSAAVLEQLNSPLRYERLTAVLALKQFEQLPAEVYGRLALIAVEDDYPPVREEAKAIVRRN